MILCDTSSLATGVPLNGAETRNWRQGWDGANARAALWFRGGAPTSTSPLLTFSAAPAVFASVWRNRPYQQCAFENHVICKEQLIHRTGALLCFPALVLDLVPPEPHLVSSLGLHRIPLLVPDE